MTHRHYAWIGWLILAICAANVVVSLSLFQRSGVPVVQSAMLVLSFLAFPTIGALVVSQRQTNTVGWLFCLAGLGATITSFSAAYTEYALYIHADAQLATAFIDLLGDLVWPINLIIGILLLFLFPDGRALSPRWRLVVRTLLFALFIMTIAQVIAPGPLESNGRVPNPLGVPALADISAAILSVTQLALPVFILLAVISLIIRYRRAMPMERQRIKWFVFGAFIMIAFVFSGIIIAGLISSNPNDPVGSFVGNASFALGILALPLGVGVGVMRYQLYDIDILIKRTLVYGSLTAILAGLYFGLVIGAQLLTRQLSGQQTTQQPFIIVLSTLLIAALFQPLRGWLQRGIDQRFYRSRYDAAQTLAAFSDTLRQEVELEALSGHLLDVVDETMRPGHISLWLNEQVLSQRMKSPTRLARTEPAKDGETA